MSEPEGPRRADRGRATEGWHGRRRGRPGMQSLWDGTRPPWGDGPPPWDDGRPPWGDVPPPWVGRRGGPPWMWAGRRGPRRFGCLFVLVGALFAIVLVSITRVLLALLGTLVAIVTGQPAAAGGGDLLSVASLLLLAIAVVGVVAAVRALSDIGRPLDDLVDAASRIESGDYAARVPTPARGPRPLRDLVRGFNTMTARLEADEAQRRSLLADVGHELRTPLAVLQGNLEAIIDGVYPADREHLEPLLDETRVLARLVEDLRTVTLAEAGTLSLHREPTDLGVLVSDVATSFRRTADAAGVEVAVEAADVPLADVDPVRLREVVANLVANAVRHTPHGGRVTITLRAAAGAGVAIAVSDTGPGIPAELLPHVFERFAKGPESTGSGLGLAIARALVEAHGGTIRATSEPGRGATFALELPIDTASAPPGAARVS